MSNSMTVYSQSGEQKGSVVLPEKIFGVKEKHDALVHEIAVAMLAGKRNVVASTKTRGEVRGGGKKPWQQKGTGRARAGSIRSPLWRGGGIMFGPRPNRVYARKVNRKAKRAGLLAVLSDRAQNGKILVLDNLELAEAKTKALAAVLAGLRGKIEGLGRKVLLVTATPSQKVIRAARNLPAVKVETAGNLNFLDVLVADQLIILADALPILEKTYLKD